MKARISLPLINVFMAGVIAVATHAAGEGPSYTVRTLPLADHGKGSITMDYIAYDPKTGYVWVPAINIGSVYVVDTSNGNVREIAGFATNEMEIGGRKRTQGPSGVSVGEGVVYIGDRADSSVCAVEAKTLARKNAETLIPLPTAWCMWRPPTKCGSQRRVTIPCESWTSASLAQKEKLFMAQGTHGIDFSGATCGQITGKQSDSCDQQGGS